MICGSQPNNNHHHRHRNRIGTERIKKKSSCFSSYRPSPNGVVNIPTTGPRTYDETKQAFKRRFEARKTWSSFPAWLVDCDYGRAFVKRRKLMILHCWIERAILAASAPKSVVCEPIFLGKERKTILPRCLLLGGGKAVRRRGGCAEGSEWKLHSDYHQVFRVPLPRLVLHRFVFFLFWCWCWSWYSVGMDVRDGREFFHEIR